MAWINKNCNHLQILRWGLAVSPGRLPVEFLGRSSFINCKICRHVFFAWRAGSEMNGCGIDRKCGIKGSQKERSAGTQSLPGLCSATNALRDFVGDWRKTLSTKVGKGGAVRRSPENFPVKNSDTACAVWRDYHKIHPGWSRGIESCPELSDGGEPIPR
jgi:hypothetical protein